MFSTEVTFCELNVNYWKYYNGSFLYYPKLWPLILSLDHRGIGMAAFPKIAESRLPSLLLYYLSLEREREIKIYFIHKHELT